MGYNNRIGSASPDHAGLAVTVFVKGISEASPVKKGDLFVQDPTHGDYGVKRCVDGDVPMFVAKAGGIVDPLHPVGAYLIGGKSRINKMKYTGTAPTLGASIVASGADTVKATATPNATVVLKVDTVLQVVEVLI
jgi:hypothetical protein